MTIIQLPTNPAAKNPKPMLRKELLLMKRSSRSNVGVISVVLKKRKKLLLAATNVKLRDIVLHAFTNGTPMFQRTSLLRLAPLAAIIATAKDACVDLLPKIYKDILALNLIRFNTQNISYITFSI